MLTWENGHLCVAVAELDAYGVDRESTQILGQLEVEQRRRDHDLPDRQHPIVERAGSLRSFKVRWVLVFCCWKESSTLAVLPLRSVRSTRSPV